MQVLGALGAQERVAREQIRVLLCERRQHGVADETCRNHPRGRRTVATSAARLEIAMTSPLPPGLTPAQADRLASSIRPSWVEVFGDIPASDAAGRHEAIASKPAASKVAPRAAAQAQVASSEQSASSLVVPTTGSPWGKVAAGVAVVALLATVTVFIVKGGAPGSDSKANTRGTPTTQTAKAPDIPAPKPIPTTEPAATAEDTQPDPATEDSGSADVANDDPPEQPEPASAEPAGETEPEPVATKPPPTPVPRPAPQPFKKKTTKPPPKKTSGSQIIHEVPF